MPSRSVNAGERGRAKRLLRFRYSNGAVLPCRVKSRAVKRLDIARRLQTHAQRCATAHRFTQQPDARSVGGPLGVLWERPTVGVRVVRVTPCAPIL